MNIRSSRFIFYFLLCLLFVSCKEELYNNQINKEEIELSCTRINNNINSLVSLLNALEKQDYVTKYSPIVENLQTVGYTFSFNESPSVVIYDKFELDIPIIGIKMDSDNSYYWTVNEDWIADENGDKINVLYSIPNIKYIENEWYAVLEGKSNIKLSSYGKSFINKLETQENIISLQLFNKTILLLPTRKRECFITKFEFKAEDNPDVLINDLTAQIVGNNIIVYIPHIVENKILKPTIAFIGDKVSFYGTNDEYINFSEPIKCIVSDKTGINKEYTVMVTAFTGLPIIYIETEGGAEIVSKNDYVNATISIKDELAENSSTELEPTAVRIKGRGNSTWSLPKKPYKLKFDTKTSLLGEPKDKEWVLLANYLDKTNLRNATAFFMGDEMTELEWTPCTHFVELVLNGVHKGTYQLSEQVKIAEDRVNVSDDGYLIEVDQLSRMEEDDVYFQTDRILLNIKDPDVEYGSEAYNWIKDYVTNVENVLYSEDFLDENTGYAQYIDMQSYVDWYLVQEIIKNNDGIFFSSCYMNIAPNGKLKMGPLWDFDLAFGNTDYNNSMDPTGFWIKNAAWISRMFEDPSFTRLIRERFDEIYNNKTVIYKYIDENADYLEYSVIENNSVWKTLHTSTWPNNYVWESYENEINKMKDFIDIRLDWLNENLPK